MTLAIVKADMVCDIQQALRKAGYPVTKRDISMVPSRRLYGLWSNYNTQRALALVAYYKKQKHAKAGVKTEVEVLFQIQTSQTEIATCKYCGYRDPEWDQADICPSCETEH